MYANYIKRMMDFLLALVCLLLLSPVFLVLSISGAIFMKGNPFYIQYRPGKDERIFPMIKFRSMTCETDDDGNDLPDEQRMTKYGHFIRATSLDELPELVNILIGQMSFVGPRPQLVKDMVFMSDRHRRRHSVRPGLTGLAQVSGRNALRWENKLELDLRYLDNISFFGDFQITLKTVKLVLFGGEAGEKETDIADDYGDFLLKKGEIDESTHREKLEEAKKLLPL